MKNFIVAVVLFGLFIDVVGIAAVLGDLQRRVTALENNPNVQILRRAGRLQFVPNANNPNGGSYALPGERRVNQ